MASRARTTSALTVLVLALGVAGCNDSSSGPDQEPSTSGSVSSTTSESTPAPSPTGVAPAAGQLIEVETATYHLPDGKWNLSTRSGDSASFADAAVSGIWQVALRETIGLDGPVDLDELAGFVGVGDPKVEDPPLERGENRVVDGVEGYTATTTTTSPGGRKTLVQIWGTGRSGLHVSLRVAGPAADPRTDEWFEAVLASIEWK